jgi:uncharacterized protein (DUF2141 family)
MKNKKFCFLSSMLLCFIFINLTSGIWAQNSESDAAEKPASGKLVIKIVDFRTNSGKARIFLFNKADGYPMKLEKAIISKYADINGLETLIEFPDLPYDSYAVCVYHDEDNNDRLNTNFIGIPKEGIAASNDANGSFGPPKYKDAVFEFNTVEKKILIHMVYF